MSEPETPAFVSVVVPAYNAERTIERCLEALHRQTLPRERYEVLVVDDASTDHTSALATDLGARVLRLEENGGPGAARNAGIEAAKGELIVFTDSDCEPTEGFLEALLRPLEEGVVKVGGSKGTYLSRQTGLVARFVQLEYERRYEVTRRDRYIDFVDTYAACFRKADLERAGGFDTRLRQCQDQELSFRLAAAGVRIAFAPEAKTYHTHSDTLRGYLRKKEGIAFWKVSVLSRHPRKAVKDSHTPQTMKLQMLLAAALPCALAATLLCALALPSLAGMAALGTAAAALGYLALTAPFALDGLRRDARLGLAVPGILWLRDLALMKGLLRGLRSAPRLGAAPGPSTSSAPRAARRPPRGARSSLVGT